MAQNEGGSGVEGMAGCGERGADCKRPGLGNRVAIP